MSDFDARKKEYNLTSFAETRAALSDPDTIVIDIRRPDEIDDHVQHANYHQVTVTLDDASALEACAPTMLPKKDAKIFVYCRSGRRATNAVQALEKHGYTNVLNGGGFSDVQAALADGNPESQ